MTKPRNSCPVKLPWGQVVSMAHRGTSRTGLGSHPFLAHVLVNTKCVFSFENCLWPIPPSLSHSTPYLCSAPAPPQTNPNQGPRPLPRSRFLFLERLCWLQPPLLRNSGSFCWSQCTVSCPRWETLTSHKRLGPLGQGPMREQQQRDIHLKGVQCHLLFPRIMGKRGP